MTLLSKGEKTDMLGRLSEAYRAPLTATNFPADTDQNRAIGKNETRTKSIFESVADSFTAPCITVDLSQKMTFHTG